MSPRRFPLTYLNVMTGCGYDGLSCAALKSLKLQTSVQLGSVLTLVGRDPWEKFLPPNGERIPCRWVGGGVGWRRGSPQNSFLLRKLGKLSTLPESHFLVFKVGAQLSPWFSCCEGTPEITPENCCLHWPVGSSSSHPYFPSPRVIFKGAPTSSIRL